MDLRRETVIERLARLAGLEVREADEAFAQTLAGLPLAQKRTSRNKAYVHVSRETIFKGPYPPRSIRLLNNLRYPYLLHLLEEALRLPECHRGVYRWQTLHACPTAGGKRYYLAGPNVGDAGRMVVESASTAVDADCRVLVRQTLLRRVSEIEKVKRGGRFTRHPSLDEDTAVASLQHLYARFVLNVGDSGTHNILVREDRPRTGRPIAGIDFDEHRRAKPGRTLWDCLCKADYSYLDEVYGELVPRVVVLQGLDPELRARIEEVNAVCAPWAEGLPRSRAAEGVVSIPDLLRRMEQVEALLRKFPG
jgi:hypothetical protein